MTDAHSEFVTCVQMAHRAQPGDYQLPNEHHVIDPEARLRRFCHGGRHLVSKLLATESAINEWMATIQAAERLHGTKVGGIQVSVLVPSLVQVDDIHSALVARDLGTPLPALPSDDALLEKTMLDLASLLVERGVEWRGFAPRNIIIHAQERRLWLIDLDGTTFSEGPLVDVARTVILKWKLNWRQVFAQGPLDRMIASLPRRAADIHKLDSFEHCLRRVLDWSGDLDHLLDLADEATLQAETPIPGEVRPGAFAIGHYLDETLPVPLSVLATFLCARLRNQNAKLAQTLYENLSRRILAIPPGQGAVQAIPLLVSILDANLSLRSGCGTSAFSHLVQRLKTQDFNCGWNGAVERAMVLGRLCSQAHMCIQDAFAFLPATNILLRGSVGQGLAARSSDIDYEISTASNGECRKGLELVLTSLLAALGIQAEGSDARPLEPDLLGLGGLSRDANEWSQLRNPTTNRRPAWLEAAFPDAPLIWWQNLSLFEMAQTWASLETASFRFKVVRATLARVAARAGCQSPLATSQWKAAQNVLHPETADRLWRLLDTALADRDSLAPPRHPVHHFASELSQVCQEAAVPNPVAMLRSKIDG
jgi:hypothetical protein